jgi:RNA polymerase sigma-70 factor (ECF subfamily)
MIETLESESPTAKPATEDWALLVQQIQQGDDRGSEKLYAIFNRGIRWNLARSIHPQDIDDRLHETFLIVVNAIRRGDLRESERLMGFVRTIARRQVAAYIEDAVGDRRRLESHSARHADHAAEGFYPDSRPDPEHQFRNSERQALMMEALHALSPRDRDLLVRFYLHEQPEKQIREAMGLTETQFRLLKSRAKARFGEIGKKKLATGAFYAALRNLTLAPTQA